MSAAPMCAFIGKNYKFTILRAKPTTVKLLWQRLWQLQVYVNMKYACKFQVFLFLFRQITNAINNHDVTFFFHIHDGMFLSVLF